MKRIKNIIVSIGVALHMFGAIQAGENMDSIPCDFINTTWQQKTRLEGVVTYENHSKIDFSLSLDSISEEMPTPTQTMLLKPGKITQFFLILQNYYESDAEPDLEAKLLASLQFKPEGGLQKIIFEIKENDIFPNPTY
jgi:hypothetical protein